MARKRKRTRTRRRAAPAAIVVRQTAPIARAAPRRRSPQRIIVGRVQRRRRRSGGGGSFVTGRLWTAVESLLPSAAAAALGYAESKGKYLPRLGPLDSSVAISVVGAVPPVIWPKSAIARSVGAVAEGIAAVAAYKCASGNMNVWLSKAERDALRAARRAEGEWEEDDG